MKNFTKNILFHSSPLVIHHTQTRSKALHLPPLGNRLGAGSCQPVTHRIPTLSLSAFPSICCS